MIAKSKRTAAAADRAEDQQLTMEQSIAAGIRQRREALGMSVNDLALRSGVSRAMISKIERVEASPTAALLGRVCNALGITLSSLIASAEATPTVPLTRVKQQPVWRDPETGLKRTMVSPMNSGSRVEIVAIELPAGAAVDYARQQVHQYEQHVLVLDGALTLTTEGRTFELEAGDCVYRHVGPAHRFENRRRKLCRYLVVIER